MNLKLIAIDCENGWGVVKEKDVYFALNPYEKKIDINAIEAYLEKDKYMEVLENEMLFESYEDVHEHLKQEFLRVRKERGEPVPSSEKIRDLLEFTDKEILQKYLDRASKELIPEKKYEAAVRIAGDVAKAAKEKGYAAVLSEAVKKIFEFASAEILQDFSDKVNAECIIEKNDDASGLVMEIALDSMEKGYEKLLKEANKILSETDGTDREKNRSDKK